MNYEEILSRFTVKKRYGNTAQCICPNHEDHQASLTISKGEKGTVVHCHAGCVTADILDKVGLKLTDLFDDELIRSIRSPEKWRAFVEGREGRKIEDVYHYVDLSGNYVFTRVRLNPKTFIYGIMDGDRFNYGLNGMKRKDISAVFCESVQSVKKAISEGQRIFYAEGEKDVKTLISRGLTGVTCGASGDWVSGCATLFEGADVVILADNDKSGKESSQKIEKDLLPVAKSVRIVTPTPDLEHGDISDYFESHTVADFEQLLIDHVDLTQFHMMNDNGKITGVFDFQILKYLKEKENLFVLGGVPYIYENGVFRSDLSGAKLKTMIRDLIYPEFVKSTTIKRIFDLFISDQELQVKPEELNLYPVEWINFRNGFYDPVNRQLIPHDPKYRATNQIPYSYDPNRGMKGKLISEWIRFICESKKEDMQMLCEFSGLCLTRDVRQQKFLILNGEGGTGKSIVIRMIEKMIGTENTSNISLNQLSQRFSAFGLMGKLLNSCADLEIDALSDTSTLKKALGEDTLSAEAKGKDAVSFRSYAKMIFSTNQLPIVKAEQTNGFYRRLLILTMNRVPEKKEADYFDKLSAEIDDFIRISVRGLERLYHDGEIIVSPGSIEAVKRLRCDSDTVEAFLSDRVLRVPDNTDNRIKKSDLYQSYEGFCREFERQSLTKQNFYRAMKTKGFGEIKTKTGTECFRGLKYREKFCENSVNFSVNDWEQLNEQQIPFDWIENTEI